MKTFSRTRTVTAGLDYVLNIRAERRREPAIGVHGGGVSAGKEFTAAFRAVWAGDAEVLQPPVAAGTRVAWGTLNAAIDHRLRYAFCDSRTLPQNVEHGIAGAFRLAGPWTGTALWRTGTTWDSCLAS